MYEFYFVSCMNIIFNKLHQQLVKYDVHTTSKIKSIHAIFYHILLFYVVYQYFTYSKIWQITCPILPLAGGASL